MDLQLLFLLINRLITSYLYDLGNGGLCLQRKEQTFSSPVKRLGFDNIRDFK